MKTDRREFLKYGLITSSLFFGGIYGAKQFKKYQKRSNHYSGHWLSQSERGHQLREALKQSTTTKIKIPTLIVGGGMTGLMTGYYLKKAGFDNFKILEMNPEPGGNSSSGQNEVSKFPWGAHYIPLPNTENKQLLEFFIDMGLAFPKSDSGIPEFKEEFLCQDPQERLFIRGEWQESLLPIKGITKEDEDQLKRFHDLVQDYKFKKGTDGKFVFDIPVMESSQDPIHLKLDRISFTDFLNQKGFTSDVVSWYMNYCTLDDFGMGADTVSAWAGLHYFCSRRPLGQYDEHKIMTWPQGNGWVLQKLSEYLKDHIQASRAVMKIQSLADGRVISRVFNFESKELAECESKNLIYAGPQFLAPFLFENKDNLPKVSSDDYYSWVVANVTVKLKPEEFQNLHWDNVRFKSQSLGYVHARHQELRGRFDGNTVLTLYWPLYDNKMTATEIRKKVSALGWDDWAPKVEAEMEAMHPGISLTIQSMDIKIYGHAMIGPRVGRMHLVFQQPWKALNKQNIYFSHTDNSGMSLFEEAHYWGHRVAQEILKNA